MLQSIRKGDFVRHLTTAFILLFGMASFAQSLLEKNDPYQHLLDSSSKKSQSWLSEQNRLADVVTIKRKEFKEFKKLTAQSQKMSKTVPNFWHQGKHLIRIHKTDEHPQGLLQFADSKTFVQTQEGWKTVLDVKKFADSKGKGHQFKGIRCLAPENIHCMVLFSFSGTDQHETFEFNRKKKVFVKNGFFVPAAKSKIYWLDKDTLLVATDWGDPKLMVGAYPIRVKLWKRNEDLKNAKTVFTGTKSGTGTFLDRPDYAHEVAIISDYVDFRDAHHYLYRNGRLSKKLPLPTKGRIAGIQNNTLYFNSRQNWQHKGVRYPEGSLLAIDMAAFFKGTFVVEKIYAPPKQSIVEWAVVTKNNIYINLLTNVKNSLYRLSLNPKKMLAVSEVGLPKTGAIYYDGSFYDSDSLFVSYENFNAPKSLKYVIGNQIKTLVSQPSYEKGEQIEVSQHWARSKDDEKIPYFVALKKGIRRNGKNPTFIYGYGASSTVMKPFYSHQVVANTISKGAIYVVANLRGGGEFGKRWNEAGKLLKKKNTFYDLIAIADDLVKRKYTRRQQIAIYGQSWGGLLALASMHLSPTSFGAVVASVPMTDMINFAKLGQPGWTGVFGDPKDKKHRKYLKSYSPYHVVKKGQGYPPVLIIGAQNDERIHPAHSRRYVAKMKDAGAAIWYREFSKGGHSLYSTDEEYAALRAHRYTFLWQHVGKQD